jgi:hypothetical protein
MRSNMDNNKYIYLDNSQYYECNGETASFKITQKRIVTKNKVIEIKNNSQESITIFKSLSCALMTDWFHGLSKLSRKGFFTL